ncbi:hypothetical protein FVEN_g7352 [Fusarium venenatum]|nr:hypothetical protein FVEN_g7352 [Fusarium venenatum]
MRAVRALWIIQLVGEVRKQDTICTGDGKADYIVQYDGGAARGYRDNGKIPVSEGRKWNDVGTIAGGVSPQGPVHYADINGDRKADCLVVFDGGAINAYMNNHDWAPKLPEKPGQPVPTEPGEGSGGGGGGGGLIRCIGGGCLELGGNCVGAGCEKDKDKDDDEEEDEDCATETNTACHQVCTTKPCVTVCNTYLGCDCTTSRVTNDWVSCQSLPCTTTSSEVITGCFLTATATTREASCPLITLDHENDLFGDDSDVFGNLGKTSKTTSSATVIVSKTACSVNDGYVTVEKTAYPIPDVDSATKTTMRGTSAIILPSQVGTTISITNKDFPVDTTSYPKATTTVGESTSTSEEPSPTTMVYPTNTLINQDDGEAYCFDKGPGYEEFTEEDTQRVIGSFCDSSYTLNPNNDFGHNSALENYGYTVIVPAK